MEGDRDAFLAPIDPIDPYAPTFLRQQGMIFDRLTSLHLGGYDLRLVSDDLNFARQKHYLRYPPTMSTFPP